MQGFILFAFPVESFFYPNFYFSLLCHCAVGTNADTKNGLMKLQYAAHKDS
jgi:hypothetical protein